MDLFLTLLSGVAWTVVYVEIIRVGFAERTYGMPVAALALNFAWEWTYAVLGLTSGPGLQTWVNLVWGVADVVILVTFFRFGRSEFPGFISRPLFVVGGIAMVLSAFVVQWLFIVQFATAGNRSATYSAFLQNLLMSGLFIALFLARRGPRGQNLLIGVAKWIGTLAPTILFGFLAGSVFVSGIGLLCSVFDLAYIGLLLWARRAPATFALPDHRSQMVGTR